MNDKNPEQLATRRQGQLRSLNAYRLIAMLLVMWGNLVGTGMYAFEIPGVIQDTMDRTIMDPAGNALAFFESFLYNRLHTQPAVLGVVMFFICTGYLVSKMLDRYTISEFVVNRAMRILPPLWVSLAVTGMVVYVSQRISFSIWQYLASGLLISHALGVVPIIGVLWTLIIEALFYIYIYIITLLRDKDKIVLCGYLSIFIINLMACEFSVGLLHRVAYDFRYMGFALLGVAISRSETNKKEGPIGGYMPAILAFGANFWLMRFGMTYLGDESTYPHFFSHAIPFALFLALLFWERKMPHIFDRMPKVLISLSELVYPVYLTHVCCGLTAMYWLSRTGMNRYLVFIMGVMVSFAVGKLVAVVIEKPSVQWGKEIVAKMKEEKTP